MKERLDVLLVKQGFAPSREKAKAILMSGIVYVDGQKEDKAGTMFDPEKIKIEVRGNTLPYVSRGGLKLEKALQVFPIDLQGKTCLDIGASTGGFTDYTYIFDQRTDLSHAKRWRKTRLEQDDWYAKVQP